MYVHNNSNLDGFNLIEGIVAIFTWCLNLINQILIVLLVSL